MSDLKNYKIIRALGEGAFGKVKRKTYSVAQHIITQKLVAIKFINIDQAKKQNLFENIRRERKILRSFNHPNIVKL